jgi:hypothetical protein
MSVGRNNHGSIPEIVPFDRRGRTIPFFYEWSAHRYSGGNSIRFTRHAENHLKSVVFHRLASFYRWLHHSLRDNFLHRNAGVSATHMPYFYFSAGILTLVTSRGIGRCIDRYGLVRAFAR